MKVTLEFSLPEEQPECDMAYRAGMAHCVVSEIQEWLRSQLKYNNELTEDQRQILENLTTYIYQDTDAPLLEG